MAELPKELFRAILASFLLFEGTQQSPTILAKDGIPLSKGTLYIFEDQADELRSSDSPYAWGYFPEQGDIKPRHPIMDRA